MRGGRSGGVNGSCPTRRQWGRLFVTLRSASHEIVTLGMLHCRSRAHRDAGLFISLGGVLCHRRRQDRQILESAFARCFRTHAAGDRGAF